MAINVNELRIGNLVTIKGTQKCIDGITKEKGVTIEDKTYLANEVSPIPLNKRIIENYGFEKAYNSCNFYYNLKLSDTLSFKFIVSCSKLYLRIKEMYLIANENNSYSDNQYPIDHIKNVHQLQNLYFDITGEELLFSQKRDVPLFLNERCHK